MKRLQHPVPSLPTPQGAAIAQAPASAQTKAVAATKPAPRWLYRDIGSAILSFPSDLRPRSV